MNELLADKCLKLFSFCVLELGVVAKASWLSTTLSTDIHRDFRTAQRTDCDSEVLLHWAEETTLHLVPLIDYTRWIDPFSLPPQSRTLPRHNTVQTE